MAPTLLGAEEAGMCGRYVQQATSNPALSKRQILSSIPCSASGSYAPLATLSSLLAAFPSSRPILELQQTHTKLWKLSPEEAKCKPGQSWLALCCPCSQLDVGPIFMCGAVLAIKKALEAVCGNIRPGQTEACSAMTNFRMQLMRTLMPVPRLQKLTELFGTHDEATSVFMRTLGAKVGKHVYWPGTGPSMQDYDLIEVGDNVVFGSRAHIVTSDGMGSDFVRIKANAMVADRVVLLPGS